MTQAYPRVCGQIGAKMGCSQIWLPVLPLLQDFSGLSYPYVLLGVLYPHHQYNLWYTQCWH